MPNPKKAESKDDYIKRFMASAEAIASFPDEAQRYAVAMSNWGSKSMSEMKKKEFEELKGVEIFSSGTYYFPQDDGTEESITYTDADVQSIADNTNKLIADDKHSPPGKLGHDGAQAFAAASGLPAIGWAQNLRRVGSKLLADFTDVPTLAYKALKAKLYKKISSEIYHAEASKKHFGVEGLTLRAVAFLGADVPKVKGLAAFLSEQPTGAEAGKDDAISVVYGEQREVTMAEKKGAGPLMVPANRHPYGALVTGAEGNDSGVEAGKQYKVHGVHTDGTYDIHDPKAEMGSNADIKGVPHDHLALMAEGSQMDRQTKKEAQMAEAKAVELAEKATKDAILLAEKNGTDAKEAKEALAKLQKETRDKAVSEFCEKHKTKLTPALQPKFKALVNAAVETGAVKFGENDEKPYIDGFMVFLSELMDAKVIALGEAAPSKGTDGGEMNAAEVKLAEEPFLVHLAEAGRSEVKPIITHGDLTVAAEEYLLKHPTKADGQPMRFSEALKHVAKLEKAAISIKGGNA